jgi:hypothetical protein
MRGNRLRTLLEIILSVKDGEKPDYEELRYAVCALDGLRFFDFRALSNLAEGKRELKRPIYTYSAEWQFQECAKRTERAMNKSPKEWVGWNNDPDNIEFLESRKISISIANKILEK